MSANRGFGLVVIGGGTAALVAVREALALGVESIALVEKRDRLGGECSLTACVPTHTLMTAAKILKNLEKQAPEYGISASKLTLNFQQLMRKVKEVINGGLDYPFTRNPRVRLLRGEASFISRLELRVDDEIIRGEKIIIATGAEPIIPNIPGLQETGFITYAKATHLKELPASFVIIGGGRIGVEFAQIFRWLGCEVSLIERENRLLPREEPEISRELETILQEDDINVVTGCNVHHISGGGGSKMVSAMSHRGECWFMAEEIMVATGRKARVEKLNLPLAGISTNNCGITVNEELQTLNPRVWAVGDVVGPYRYTHIADSQAVIATRNAIANAHIPVDYVALPLAVFTEPAVARVGITEAEARQIYGEDCLILTALANETNRFNMDSMPRGFIKIIVDPATDQVVGGHILAEEADETIHLLAMAIKYQIPVLHLTKLIYVYPTHAQIVQKALEKYPELMLKRARSLQRQKITPPLEK